jgi:subtilase family protein
VAPGQNLISASFHGGLARASGTSQATALVSGAAALLKTRYGWEPWKIKQRLISTSNLYPWLTQDKDHSLGGLLDIGRAVEAGDGAIIRKQDGTECSGRIDTSDRKTKLYFTNHLQKTIGITYSQIRRLRIDKDQQRVVIYYSDILDSEPDSNPGAPVVLHREIVSLPDIGNPDSPASPSGIFRFVADGGQSQCVYQKIDIRDLEDFFNGFY